MRALTRQPVCAGLLILAGRRRSKFVKSAATTTTTFAGINGTHTPMTLSATARLIGKLERRSNMHDNKSIFGFIMLLVLILQGSFLVTVVAVACSLLITCIAELALVVLYMLDTI
jgi:hypothetical protein